MNFFTKLQSLGKALMLPIAVLPAAALFLRLGQPDLLNIPFVSAAGSAIFDNLPLLFGIGVAIGLSYDGAGAAGLAGAIGQLILVAGTKAINPAINMGVFSGILGGITGAMMYNRFSEIVLPDWLGFFAGRRFVPIVTGLCCLILSGIFGFIWVPIQNGLDAVATWMTSVGAWGAFSYGVANRLLIPLGLHHIINNIVWFVFGSFEVVRDGVTVVVHGDINRFFAGDPTAGMFMAGMFPMMMFGLPAAAFAMYLMARKENKAHVGGILFSVAFTAFLTGITEPLEFSFMFIAPVLYGIHAILTGISLAVAVLLDIHHGFGFSAGVIDYVLNFRLSHNGWLIIPMGLVLSVIYFFLFMIAIKVFNIPTPGREADDDLSDVSGKTVKEKAALILAALGGKKNLTTIDACITRLRLNVVDSSLVDEAALKKLGAKAVLKLDKTSVQVVMGTQSENLAMAMKDM